MASLLMLRKPLALLKTMAERHGFTVDIKEAADPDGDSG